MLKDKIQYIHLQRALFANLSLSLLLFSACRCVFLFYNLSYYTPVTAGDLFRIFKGGLLFDVSALLYLNILYILMMAFPIASRGAIGYQKVAKVVFILFNGLGIIVNLMDTAYFPYTNRRTTMAVFSEFSGNDNIMIVMGREIIHSWHLTLVGVLLIYLLFKFYKKPLHQNVQVCSWKYYIPQVLIFICIIPCVVIGIRGGVKRGIRPITNNTAILYANKPVDAVAILNTPFSMIRNIGKKVYSDPMYYKDKQEMERIFTPVHRPVPAEPFKPLNVVVFILESFGKEYIGVYNKLLEEGTYKGYTPFLDSLIRESLTYEYSYANGRKSIDAMPSVFSSIPMLTESYFMTHYATNKITSLPAELKGKGYHTAFFHAAVNGSMSFQAFAEACGFDEYYGLDEYERKEDHDGVWGIWDEEFFQYFSDKLTSFQQPFMAGLFSLTSHHPFQIPKQYAEIYPEEKHPIYKCIRYTDHALKLFFEKARQETWFDNTLFVLVADHTNMPEHEIYQTDAGRYAVPIIFYHPGGNLKGYRSVVSQQIDIMPTVLGYLNYNRPYVSFGRDLFHTPDSTGYAINCNNQMYQYFKGDYMLEFDGLKSRALYNLKEDNLLVRNLLNSTDKQAADMEAELKAIVQQYMERMLNNKLTDAN